MWDAHDPVQPHDFAVAAALSLPFVLLVGALLRTIPPTSAERAGADPLIKLLRGAGPVLPITLTIAVAWLALSRPRAPQLRRGLIQALAGAVAAVAATLVIFALAGATLPSFIPPEESARAGLTNGVAAGLVEESAFRLALLPLFYALARRRLALYPAIIVAAIGTGLLFSLAHELGPASAPFALGYLATRALVPGMAMSLIALRVSPAFIVSAHCTAHLMIPALFS